MDDFNFAKSLGIFARELRFCFATFWCKWFSRFNISHRLISHSISLKTTSIIMSRKSVTSILINSKIQNLHLLLQLLLLHLLPICCKSRWAFLNSTHRMLFVLHFCIRNRLLFCWDHTKTHVLNLINWLLQKLKTNLI